jgi:hypothetical protein
MRSHCSNELQNTRCYTYRSVERHFVAARDAPLLWALRFLVGHAYLLELSLARVVLVVGVSNALRQSADLVQLFDSFKTEEFTRNSSPRSGAARQIAQLVPRFAARLQCNVYASKKPRRYTLAVHVSTEQCINRIQIHINEVTLVSLPLVCVVLYCFCLKASVS